MSTIICKVIYSRIMAMVKLKISPIIRTFNYFFGNANFNISRTAEVNFTCVICYLETSVALYYTQWKLDWDNLCVFILVSIKACNAADDLGISEYSQRR